MLAILRLTAWLLLLIWASVICALGLYLFSLLGLILPWQRVQQGCQRLVYRFERFFMQQVTWGLKHISRVQIDIQYEGTLSSEGRYISVGNHQSWMDGFIWFYLTSTQQLPSLRPFIKRELLWIPILNLIPLALHYPVMRRYSRAHLDKNPHLKQKDLKTIQNSCQRLAHDPFNLVIFVEGTRWTPEKYDQQQPPYRHLLNPKSKGLFQALSHLGNNIDRLIDFTFIFPDNPQATFLDLLAGHVPHVIIQLSDVKTAPLLALSRSELHDWLTERWSLKDQHLQRYY